MSRQPKLTEAVRVKKVRIYKKALIDALFLTFRNMAVPTISERGTGNKTDPHAYLYVSARLRREARQEGLMNDDSTIFINKPFY